MVLADSDELLIVLDGLVRFRVNEAVAKPEGELVAFLRECKFTRDDMAKLHGVLARLLEETHE